MDDRLPQGGCNAFMSFVDDDQVPVGSKDILILLEFTGGFVPRASQVLHGGKVDEWSTRLCERVERFAHLRLTVLFVVARLGTIQVAIELDKVEIVEPSIFHCRAMREDERLAESTLPHRLKGAQRLAETHLGVPQHFALIGEESCGLTDGRNLLLTERDDNVRLLVGRTVDAVSAFLYCGDGAFHYLHVANVEPLLWSALQTGEHMSGVTAVE